MKQKKTNAARRLDELKIAYRLMEYTVAANAAFWRLFSSTAFSS